MMAIYILFPFRFFHNPELAQAFPCLSGLFQLAFTFAVLTVLVQDQQKVFAQEALGIDRLLTARVRLLFHVIMLHLANTFLRLGHPLAALAPKPSAGHHLSRLNFALARPGHLELRLQLLLAGGLLLACLQEHLILSFAHLISNTKCRSLLLLLLLRGLGGLGLL